MKPNETIVTIWSEQLNKILRRHQKPTVRRKNDFDAEEQVVIFNISLKNSLTVVAFFINEFILNYDSAGKIL